MADLERYLDMHLRVSWKGRRRRLLLDNGDGDDRLCPVFMTLLVQEVVIAPWELGKEFPRSMVMTGATKVRLHSWDEVGEMNREDDARPTRENILEDHIRMDISTVIKYE